MGVKRTERPAPPASGAVAVYSDFVYERPLIVFFAAIILFGAVPLTLLFVFPLQLDNNPEKGFDTRDTVYAGPRLAWAALQPSLLLGSRVVVDVAKNGSNQNISTAPRTRRDEESSTQPSHFLDIVSLLDTSVDVQNMRRLRRQNAIAENDTTDVSKSVDDREKRSWADDLLSSFGSVPCYDAPIPAMNYLSQLMITVPSYEDIYSMKVLQDLCSLQDKLGRHMRPFDQLTPYRSIWHVANFFACFAPESRLNCTYLTLSDLKSVRKDVETCTLHRKAIINCRRSCEFHQSIMEEIQNADKIAHCDASCKRAAGVASHCASQMMSDLFYRILPKDLMARPFHMNVFLPFYTYGSYRMQSYDVKLNAYSDFERRAIDVAAVSDNYKLRGLLMDVKRDILFEAAISDSKFSLIAAICVFALIALYSLSLSYSTAVLAQLTLSVVSALAIYRIFNAEFPLLNLTVFVLLISIGSDGAFLLFSGFPNAETLNRQTFRECVRHTAATMFLTQFSTVVPFFLNILSSVIAFRSFGLFAGLTLITNYLLLISFMPAFLIIQYRFVNPWLVRRLPSSLWYCFPSFSFAERSAKRQFIDVNPSRKMITLSDTTMTAESGQRSLRLDGAFGADSNDRTFFERLCSSALCLLHDILPAVLIQGRLVWIGSLTVVLAFASVICATQLRLPQYNPLQLFVNSNPHEYYDNHAEKLFYFVSTKVALPLNIRLVWGIDPLYSLDHFNPVKLSAPTIDANFRLATAQQLRQLAEQLHAFRTADFIQHPHKFWPERFLDWSRLLACEDSEVVCCNLESPHYADTFIDYCMRVSTAQLQTQYNDTPIYHNVTFELVGYTALLPTNLKYSHRYNNLSDSFKHFDKTFHSRVKELPMWYTTEWYLMSTWFDLQRSIITDCQLSVVVSSLVVLVFAAIILRWKSICAMITIPSIIVTTTGIVVFFGWEIGVLEGVILVLVVGLSFDYTLHYGAAIPSHGCAAHRLQASTRKATLPVTMAALSSIIAGAAMLFAQTHAFFQVAIFLVVSTSVSFLFSTFFFLPLFYVLSPSQVACAHCDADKQRAEIPLANYGSRNIERAG